MTRQIKYTIYWSYLGPGVKRQGRLSDLVVDIPYLMDATGVIPPLAVLNQVLRAGGDQGGMGPGTKWRPFSIGTMEYDELVAELRAMEPAKIRDEHPYIDYQQAIVDADLNDCSDLIAWMTKRRAKYPLT